MKKIILILFMIFATSLSFGACTSDQIDIAGDGTNCQTAHFTLTTTSTNSFQFKLSAAGIFYVDCGNGGNLQGTGASGKTITRSDTTEETYTCTWSSGAVQTIRFGGSATDYNTDTAVATIKFNIAGSSDANAQKIASISGNLSVIFPYIVGNAKDGAQPRFRNSFQKATNLTFVPDTLFANYTIPSAFMFYGTFQGCTGLTSLPPDLFGGFTAGTTGMFAFTFYGCTGLTSIPAGLFSRFTTGGIDMFYSTFNGCTGLTSLPAGLFSSFTTGGTYMFVSTFSGCTGLTSLPSNLFSGFIRPEKYLFANTFVDCTNLSGYIPPSTFAGLIANGSPVDENMWSNTFLNTQLDTTCPSGTTEYTTGYQSSWGGKVSCVDENLTCDAGEYLSAHGYECTTCPINNVCSGGTYTFNETTDQGIQSCASGTFAPTGSAFCYPHILHVGDSNVYLKSIKQTTPSLNIRIGNDVFYANMTTERTTMNKDSSRYLHINLNDIHYYVCDDTICPQ